MHFNEAALARGIDFQHEISKLRRRLRYQPKDMYATYTLHGGPFDKMKMDLTSSSTAPFVLGKFHGQYVTKARLETPVGELRYQPDNYKLYWKDMP